MGCQRLASSATPLPVDEDTWLVAVYPGVVTRRAMHDLARTELELLPVVHDDLHVA